MTEEKDIGARLLEIVSGNEDITHKTRLKRIRAVANGIAYDRDYLCDVFQEFLVELIDWSI